MNHREFDKAVVLGAGGFIGLNLVKELRRLGKKIVCFDRQLSPQWPNDVVTVLGDFTSSAPDQLAEHFENAVIYHLISTSRPTTSSAGAVSEIESNLIPSLKLFEHSRDLRCKWIFASSGGTVYGEQVTEKIAESHSTDPINSYGITKLAIEKYLALYGKLYEMEYVVARISNPYGPWQERVNGQGIVSTFIKKILAKEDIDIWGDGEIVRDFLFVADAAEALVKLGSTVTASGVYNVGSGCGTSLNELLRLIEEISGITPKVNYRIGRKIDVHKNILDISKIIRDTKWSPSTELSQGIIKFIDHIKKI